MNGTAISIEPEDLELPPFNMSDWSCGGGMRQDVRWKFGMPPVNNANYAWIQHFIHHLSPVGVAGCKFSCEIRPSTRIANRVTF
jgi:type I restriction-modification system DNA methylase subunit